MKAPTKEPLNEQLKARAIWVGYIKAVQVIFPVPCEGVTKYEVYKDGQLALQVDAGKEISPSIFDHDKHTNLFWKTSPHELYYQDEDVESFSTHVYAVHAIRESVFGNEIFRLKSRDLEVKVG